MRYIVHGAGAIGGTIGWKLHDSGHDVTLIARGEHLGVMRRSGLRLVQPDRDERLPVPVAGSPEEIAFADDDMVILATKTQHALPALDSLARVAPPTIGVVCAQNGVESERLALRRFADVYGMCVMMPATLTQPGEVHAFGVPHIGILDVGRYVGGVDDRVRGLSSDLEKAGFASRVEPDIMRIKYRKLLLNLHNALEALGGMEAKTSDLADRARQEALEVFAAAGIEAATAEEDRQRRRGTMELQEDPERPRGGSSSWQSVARASGSIESDYLNGEIVLLGRLHGVPTPVNAVIQHAARRLAAERGAAGSVALEDLRAMVDRAVEQADSRP